MLDLFFGWTFYCKWDYRLSGSPFSSCGLIPLYEDASNCGKSSMNQMPPLGNLGKNHSTVFEPIITHASNHPVKWDNMVITLSELFKGKPKQRCEYSINLMASDICLSNDTFLNNCTRPRSFFKSTMQPCDFTWKVISEGEIWFTLRPILPLCLLTSQISWPIKLTWSDPSFIKYQPLGSSREVTILKMLSVLKQTSVHKFLYAV